MHMHAHRDAKMAHTQTLQPTAHSLNPAPGAGAHLRPATNRCTLACADLLVLHRRSLACAP